VSIWFVTPAWQRFELTAICLEQRRRVIDQMNKWGYEAYCVVIADDENLDTAQRLGFSTLKRDNEWLGRKFNDGMEFAVEHGARWVVPIGSDSWIDPWYFRHLPPDNPNIVRTSELYAPVERNRVALCRVAHRTNPAGPNMFHRDLLKKVCYRPAPDEIKRSVDGSTIRALWPFRWQRQNVHPLQYIGFRLPPFITKYESLQRKWGVVEYADPWQRLAKHYDQDLVDRAQAVLQAQP
jgi:hypothetical protein